jgi:hypothetical protein
MDAEPLETLTGCPDNSQVQVAMLREISRSMEGMNPDQLAIIRLRERYSERVELLVKIRI